MSDEPSDAQKLIAEVIAKAWAKAQDDAYLHGAWNSTPTVDPDEWAVEVDKALGGLTQEWATEFDSWYRNTRGEKRDYVEHFDYKGDEHSARDHVRTSKGVRLVNRFVSGWTVTE